MGVLEDSGLLPRSVPALTRGYDEEVTDGRSLEIILNNVIDGSGTPLDYTTLDAICTVWSKVGGDIVVELETAWSTVDGKTRLTISKGDDDMVGLALGRKSRSCVWELFLDDGADSLTVWAAHDSYLTIHGRG